MMKNLKVGQRIYLLHKIKTRIIPCQIVEEVIKRTLKGEVTSYKINNGDQEVFLDTIPDVIVFDDLQEAKNFLINRFVATINELVLEIEKNSIELFGQEDMPYSEANIQAE
jgi:hypothetical protein